MSIKELSINGFRSLKQVTWKPGNLNVIIGANGTGKSNLLRFLEMLSVVAEGNLGKYVQSLGGFDAISWDGQAPSISLDLRWDSVSPVPDHYNLRLDGLGSSYIIGNEVLSDDKHEEMFIERTSTRARFREDVVEKFQELSLRTLSLEETILSGISMAFRWEYDLPTFKAALSSIVVHHDIRVDRNAALRLPAVTRFEQRVESDGQNLINVLHTLYTGNREFERNIDEGMRAAFGEDYVKIVFPPAADQRVQLRVRWKHLKRETSAADLSDGTLRFLFLLTVLASPDPAPVIAIDEPEAGLHPAMLPIIAEYAVDASLRTQVVFTTHSPQLLDAFTETKPTTTITKWQDGETVLHNISGDDLEYWLQEYKLGALFKSGELERMG